MEETYSDGVANNVLPATKSDKQGKVDEIKLRIKQLREERIAKHAARVEMLKKKNLEKYGNVSTSIPLLKRNGSGDLSKTVKGPKQSISNGSMKSYEKLDKPHHKLPAPTATKATSTSTLLPPRDLKASNASVRKSRYDNIEKKVDCHLSFVSKPKTSISKLPLSNGHQGKEIIKEEIIDLKPKPSTDVFNNKSKAFKESAVKAHPIYIKKSLSAGDRLSKPTMTSASLGTLHLDKGRKVPEKSQNGDQPLQNKRWTMASIERLSRPKVAPVLPIIQRPATATHSRKSFAVPSNIPDKMKPKRVTEIHKPTNPPKKDFKEQATLRRSLSTVHLKHMGPEAAKKCLKRTLSAGNLKRKDIEDEVLIELLPKDYMLPVESERKKSVKFLTPARKTATPPVFLNTPKPSELRQRLNDWLQRRGKSLSSYQHLHCFGIHKLGSAQKQPDPIVESTEDDENKENVEVADDDSFDEMMTGKVKDVAAEWRRASYQIGVDSPALQQRTPDTSPILKQITPEKPKCVIDSNVIGALNDLHQVILEGYSWHQCAEWLVAIVRSCGTVVTETAQYWECRAALEEKRGDFPRAVECYNKAIMQGAQPIEVEASLDHLLQKFMKLNLDPESKATQNVDPKFLDVKNVFKSTLIRFAIQQRNIFESQGNTESLKTKYVATPVRRSSRLSKVPVIQSTSKTERPSVNKIVGSIKKPVIGAAIPKSPFLERTKTPLKAPTPLDKSARKSVGRQHLVQLCSTLQNVDDEIRSKMVFVPNKALTFNDC